MMKWYLHSLIRWNLKHFSALTILLAFVTLNAFADDVKYTDSWGTPGLTVESQNPLSVTLNYSIREFSLSDLQVNGESMLNLELPGHILPNNEGAPNLPGSGRYIAIPQGSEATVNIVSYRSETINNVNLAPAFRIPWDTEKGPLEYMKDESIFSVNKFYPEEPILLSKKDVIRGIDVVMLGVTPFHYNPVTRQLIIYRDLKIEVTFEGGNGHFGEDRLRSRWWDPMLSDMLLNYESLAKVDYNKNFQATDETGCEYLIITPNGPEFQQWADSIRDFRTKQGILTNIVTLAEIGGSTTTIIENYINNAFNNWDIVPAACLLLADFGTNATNSITSPIWDSYCASDNIYADVNNNDMPDIVFARMTAQNAAHLQVMVTKFLNYERNPPTDEYFYDHPITALGFQTERWFQICSEAVAGFWENEQGKSTVRINKTYIGNPTSDPWSTATNTTTVVNFFGPNGLGYIPSTPGQVNCTWNGTAANVVTAINNGSFMLQHRDHGFESGWGEPAFTNSNIPSLNNTDLIFVWSINCLTGKYNYSNECFAEKFHRYTYNGQNAGALGLNAASEISYSFVNDAYAWGAFDNMWPEFMPTYGSTPEPRGILPAFGSAAGKYFLQASSWPYNTSNKEVTYNLFHHHGDAFMTVYSEVPQNLTVNHNPSIYAGVTSFDVTANEDALIALTVNGEIIATAIGTGSPVSIAIPGQQPPDQVLITITKQNYYRYSSLIEVIPPAGPYIVQNVVILNDAAGNGNGIMETSEEILASISVQNVGIESANNVTVTISSSDEFITITDNNEFYGSIAAGEISTITDGFALTVADNIPDLHQVSFELNATDGTETWTTYFFILGHGPLLETGGFSIDDSPGNNNGRLDPGETADIIISVYNNGSFDAPGSVASINVNSGFLTLNNTTFDLGNIAEGSMVDAIFNVTAAINTPIGTSININADIISGGYNIQQTFTTSIGLIVEDWESGDMSQFDWVTGGNSNWALNSTNPYEGAYSIKSGAINHNQSNYLSLQYELFSADSISFWYKVSSESGYDFLTFFIDNIEKISWSGEVGWERAAFAVTAGTHTFKWEYSKDQSVVGGSDCAWVDFIVLPASVFEAFFIANETDICEGGSINYYDQSSGSAVSWEWIFEGGTPSSSTLQNPVVTYLNSGVYDVSLTASDGEASVSITQENYITVNTLPGIAPVPTGLTMVCADWGNTSYTTAGLSGITSYDWVIEPANAGNVSGTGLTATVQWTAGFLGNATLKVAGENVCGAGTYSNPINITRYLPEVSLESFDWICLGWPSFELTGGYPAGGEYSGPGVDNGWFDPATAGAGTHTITYTYGDPNGCENFTTGTILVDPCTGIEDAAGNTEVQIFPNPNNGSFTLVLNLTTDNNVDLKIFNSLNELVFEENNISVVKNLKHQVELNALSKGIYYLQVSGNSTDQVIKIIVQK